MKSGQFAFPPITDVRIDQAEGRDRHRPRQGGRRWGSTMQQVGADLSAMLGGNFVNRFNIDGRSYKVIPQVERADRLTPDQLDEHLRHGPERPARTAQRRRDDPRQAIEPRTLNRFQQLNAVKISGVAPRSLDGGAAQFSRTRPRRSCRTATASTTRASRGSSGRRAGKFLPAMGLALVLIFLVLAAQFNSFRDPFVILAGSVPLAMFGALIFTFLKFAGPPGHALQADRGVDDDAQHLLAGRPGHARRPGLEERHPDRRVRQRSAGSAGSRSSRPCAWRRRRGSDPS